MNPSLPQRAARASAAGESFYGWMRARRVDLYAPHSAYFGARFARIRCSVRRCMLRRRAVSDTLRPHSS
jgi:hypothetical protein